MQALMKNLNGKYKEPELTEKQEKGIEFFKKKSRIISRQIKELLQAKLCELGYTIKHVDYIDDYMKTVSPIVHFKALTCLQYMEKDTHYRNLFETNTSSGSRSFPSRENWEDNLFMKKYSDATPFERVKYGAINIFKSPYGVSSAYRYGESYMVLHDELKDRVSFVFGDSSSKQPHMCSFNNYYQIFYYMPDSCLRFVADRIDGNNSTEPTMPYVECQIHGPLRLKDDIKYIVLNDKHKHDEVLCYRYKKLFEVRFMSDLK